MNTAIPVIAPKTNEPCWDPSPERGSQPATRLVDRYGRTIDHLRVSVTDRCNLRCAYCMPGECTFLPARELLTFEEITRLVRLLTHLGVRKLRLTGGEPTVRKGLPELIRTLSAIEGIDDLAVTTNGVLLEEQAEPLYQAGLRRINVSLDTLTREKFHQLTRRDALNKVLRGLSEAQRVGFSPIKINVVAIRSFAEEEFLDFASLARVSPHQIRFIEYMPFPGGDAWDLGKVVPAREIVELISSRWPLRPLPSSKSGPATLFRFEDGIGGTIGIIPSVTEPFCSRCNRIRITPDGGLRTCLFSVHETDLRGLLRGRSTDEEIAEAVVSAVREKEPGSGLDQHARVRSSRAMHCIGG